MIKNSGLIFSPSQTAKDLEPICEAILNLIQDLDPLIPESKEKSKGIKKLIQAKDLLIQAKLQRPGMTKLEATIIDLLLEKQPLGIVEIYEALKGRGMSQRQVQETVWALITKGMISPNETWRLEVNPTRFKV